MTIIEDLGEEGSRITMAKSFIIFAAVAAIAIQGYADGKPVEKSQIEIMAENVKAFADSFSKTLGLQDVTSEKVLKNINEQAKVFADNLNTIKSKVDKEVKAHEGDVKKSLRDFEGNLAKTVESISNIVDPEKKAKKTAEEVRAQFDANFKNVADSFDKMVKSFQPGVQDTQAKLEKLSKTVMENLLEAGKEIQSKLNKAVEDHQKTHKH